MNLTDFPMPQNITSLTEDDVNTAVVQFINKFAGYSTNGRIRIAGESRIPLPTDNDFAIFQIIHQSRSGTNATQFEVDDEDEEGTYIEIETVQADIQISCYGEPGGNAHRKAQALETAARSYVGTRFFANYSIGCDYATAPKQLMIEDSERQYVDRWVVTLTLSYNTVLSMELPYIDSANISVKPADAVNGTTD